MIIIRGPRPQAGNLAPPLGVAPQQSPLAGTRSPLAQALALPHVSPFRVSRTVTWHSRKFAKPQNGCLQQPNNHLNNDLQPFPLPQSRRKLPRPQNRRKCRDHLWCPIMTQKASDRQTRDKPVRASPFTSSRFPGLMPISAQTLVLSFQASSAPAKAFGILS